MTRKIESFHSTNFALDFCNLPITEKIPTLEVKYIRSEFFGAIDTAAVFAKRSCNVNYLATPNINVRSRQGNDNAIINITVKIINTG